MGNRLRKTLLQPKVKTMIGLIAIDEAHLVQHWGIKSWQESARLDLLGGLFRKAVRRYCCSATLDVTTLNEVIEKVGLDRSRLKIQKTSIDWPELVYQLATISSKKKGYFLYLAFPRGATHWIGHPQDSYSSIGRRRHIRRRIAWLSICTDGKTDFPSKMPARRFRYTIGRRLKATSKR